MNEQSAENWTGRELLAAFMHLRNCEGLFELLV